MLSFFGEGGMGGAFWGGEGGEIKKFWGSSKFFCMQKSTYFPLNKNKTPKKFSACGELWKGDFTSCNINYFFLLNISTHNISAPNTHFRCWEGKFKVHPVQYPISPIHIKIIDRIFNPSSPPQKKTEFFFWRGLIPKCFLMVLFLSL